MVCKPLGSRNPLHVESPQAAQLYAAQPVCWEGTGARTYAEFTAYKLHVKLQMSLIWHVHALSVHLCIEKGEITGLCSESARPSGEKYTRVGGERRLVTSRFRPPVSRFLVFPGDVLTPFFSGVTSLFLRNIICGYYTGFAPSSAPNHPLPTTKWRLTPQRPEALKKIVALRVVMLLFFNPLFWNSRVLMGKLKPAPTGQCEC